MNIRKDISIREHNSFGVDVKAAFFSESHNIEDLKLLLKKDIHPEVFILSGGSNLLLTKDINAHVIKICHKGIHLISETDTEVVLEVAAGENWHDFVIWCIDHQYGGIENLSLIPGCVGSAPIQNIGAYGVELKDVFVSCKVIEKETLEEKELSAKDCQFGYRSSIFKTTAKGQYIIYSVVLCLNKKPHLLKTDYGDIQRVLNDHGTAGVPSIKSVSDAVIAIRNAKLPNPKVLGNSGSFFKNPVVDGVFFENFHAHFPEAPFFKIADNQFKIPAGWLIEKSGLKGHRENDAGIHDKQALVLVNHGKATGLELLALANKVIQTVQQRFSIILEPEVNII